MGMFDRVEFELPCPNCGTVISTPNWQSKDGPCGFLLVQPETVESFYSGCPNCHSWIVMKVIPRQIVVASCSLPEPAPGHGDIEPCPGMPESASPNAEADG